MGESATVELLTTPALPGVSERFVDQTTS